jgi:putative membrane protein
MLMPLKQTCKKIKAAATLLTRVTNPMLLGCENSSSIDSTQTADCANEAKADNVQTTDNSTAVAEDDAEFAVDIANGGMAQVQLGELAQSKGTGPKVTEFGFL